jgi:hypothetical protein
MPAQRVSSIPHAVPHLEYSLAATVVPGAHDEIPKVYALKVSSQTGDYGDYGDYVFFL